MILDINIKDDGFATIISKDDFGLVEEKNVKWKEFLSRYMSIVNESVDLDEFVYLPPGTIEFSKSDISKIYKIHTFNYRRYYGIEEEDDFLIIVTFDMMGKQMRDIEAYKTRGAFNKTLSRFIKIADDKQVVGVENVDMGIKYIVDCMKKSDKIPLGMKKKYSDI